MVHNNRIPRERLALLARRVHRLGDRPLFELLRELDAGAPLHERLEAYARLEPLAPLIDAFDGRDLPPLRAVGGGRR